MKIITDYRLFTSELNHALWWLGNFTEYTNSSMKAVTVTGFTEGSVVVSWSNNSINSINPPYRCPGPQIYRLFTAMQSGALLTSLSQYHIDSVDLRLKGICSEYTTSTTTVRTSMRTTTTSTETTRTTTPTTTTPTTTSELPLPNNTTGCYQVHNS